MVIRRLLLGCFLLNWPVFHRPFTFYSVPGVKQPLQAFRAREQLLAVCIRRPAVRGMYRSGCESEGALARQMPPLARVFSRSRTGWSDGARGRDKPYRLILLCQKQRFKYAASFLYSGIFLPWTTSLCRR